MRLLWPRKKDSREAGDVQWLTHEEMDSIIDYRAQKVLGISGAEFQLRWSQGYYKNVDCDSKPGLVELFMLAGTGKPVSKK